MSINLNRIEVETLQQLLLHVVHRILQALSLDRKLLGQKDRCFQMKFHNKIVFSLTIILSQMLRHSILPSQSGGEFTTEGVAKVAAPYEGFTNIKEIL